MTYLDQSEIASNGAMNSRVAQCAAQQSIPDYNTWAAENAREWAAAPGWDAAWASAKAAHPPLEGETGEYASNYDPGRDQAVITDEMILSQVQAMNTGS